MRAVTLYRLSGLAVLIGMSIMGVASVLYSRAEGVALYRDPLVPLDDLAKLFGSLIFLAGLPGLYAFQASRAGKLGLAGFVLSFIGLAMLEVSTEALFAFSGPVLAAHDQTQFLLVGGLDQHLGGGFTAYFGLSYLIVLAGFLSYGIATLRAGVYPRWAGAMIATWPGRGRHHGPTGNCARRPVPHRPARCTGCLLGVRMVWMAPAAPSKLVSESWPAALMGTPAGGRRKRVRSGGTTPAARR
jgi:hypothetical protein